MGIPGRALSNCRLSDCIWAQSCASGQRTAVVCDLVAPDLRQVSACLVRSDYMRTVLANRAAARWVIEADVGMKW